MMPSNSDQGANLQKPRNKRMSRAITYSFQKLTDRSARVDLPWSGHVALRAGGQLNSVEHTNMCDDRKVSE